MPSEEVRRLLKLFGVAVTEFEDGKSQTHIAILRKRKQIQGDTRIADSRSTCNESRTHDNFSTLPLLCQKKSQLKYECGHKRAYESLFAAAKLVVMR
jgi:hypothetical protein